jgi:acetyltransferase-like isoleucine patch superfamily enzyme
MQRREMVDRRRTEVITSDTPVSERRQRWARFWARQSGPGLSRRIASWLALWSAPPFYARLGLVKDNPKGFISPRAALYHPGLRIGRYVLVDDGVLIFQDESGGPVELGDGVHVWRDTIIQTGQGGSVVIGPDTHIQPRCQFSAYKNDIRIGSRVEIAPNCAFYPYDHGIAEGTPISAQPLQSKGPIIVGDEAWLGVGVIVLAGVRIGQGAVVGAGAVVTHDIGEGAVAWGVPARVLRLRDHNAIQTAVPTGSQNRNG